MGWIVLFMFGMTYLMQCCSIVTLVFEFWKKSKSDGRETFIYIIVSEVSDLEPLEFKYECV